MNFPCFNAALEKMDNILRENWQKIPFYNMKFKEDISELLTSKPSIIKD